MLRRMALEVFSFILRHLKQGQRATISTFILRRSEGLGAAISASKEGRIAGFMCVLVFRYFKMLSQAAFSERCM